MNIPKKISQKIIEGKKLLLVSGKQNMVIYESNQKTIKKVARFKVVQPTYSDNEGHFKVRSKGKVMRSGSVRETNDSEVINKFISELKLQLKSFSASNYDCIYLYCPTHLKNIIKESLPKTFQKKIHSVIEGNYYSKKPAFILEKIMTPKNKNISHQKSIEASKILKKNNIARMYVKGTPDTL